MRTCRECGYSKKADTGCFRPGYANWCLNWLPKDCIEVWDEEEFFTITCLNCGEEMESSIEDSTLYFCYSCESWMYKTEDGPISYRRPSLQNEQDVIEIPEGSMLVLNSLEES